MLPAARSVASIPGGTELLAEWGHQAAQILGTVNARLGRIFDAMSPDDMETTLDWCNNLPTTHSMAIVRALADG